MGSKSEVLVNLFHLTSFSRPRLIAPRTLNLLKECIIMLPAVLFSPWGIPGWLRSHGAVGTDASGEVVRCQECVIPFRVVATKCIIEHRQKVKYQ